MIDIEADECIANNAKNIGKILTSQSTEYECQSPNPTTHDYHVEAARPKQVLQQSTKVIKYKCQSTNSTKYKYHGDDAWSKPEVTKYKCQSTNSTKYEWHVTKPNVQFEGHCGLAKNEDLAMRLSVRNTPKTDIFGPQLAQTWHWGQDKIDAHRPRVCLPPCQVRRASGPEPRILSLIHI